MNIRNSAEVRPKDYKIQTKIQKNTLLALRTADDYKAEVLDIMLFTFYGGILNLKLFKKLNFLIFLLRFSNLSRWKCSASCCSLSTEAATLLGLLPMTLTHTSGLRLFFTAAHCALFPETSLFHSEETDPHGCLLASP